MKLLKVGAAVLGLHLIGFILVFVYPGCSSTPRDSASLPPSEADTLPMQPVEPLPMDPAPVQPNRIEPSPFAADTPSTTLRLPPTRPENAALPAPSIGPSESGPASSSEYTVAQGDTLTKIASRTGTSVDELLRANGLSRTSVLKIGQVLRIPAAQSQAARTEPATHSGPATGGTKYTVRSGDSLYLIARKNGTTVQALKEANRLSSDRLDVGQILVLPSGSVGTPAPSAPGPKLSAPEPASPAGTHVVAAGETIGAIARKHRVNAAEIMRANNISDPRKLQVGQRLVIPGSSAKPPTVRPAAPIDTATPSGPALTPAPEEQELPVLPPADSSQPVLPSADESEPMIPVLLLDEEPNP